MFARTASLTTAPAKAPQEQTQTAIPTEAINTKLTSMHTAAPQGAPPEITTLSTTKEHTQASVASQTIETNTASTVEPTVEIPISSLFYQI